jgi:ribokinase
MDVKVCVVGSLNMDLVVRTPRMPRPGETVVGARFAAHPGGKGANQAVAAARLGARAALVGAVGADAWGSELRSVLASEGIDFEHVVRLSDAPTGVAVITVADGGENQIVVASGANHALTADHVQAAHDEIAAADVLLLQNEVPGAANLRAAQIAKKAEVRVVLNAAPAVEVSAELMSLADVLIVNAAEARELAGVKDGEDVSPAGIARRLATRGPLHVAVTLGPEGALLFDGETVIRQSAPDVAVVDRVGAGDAFAACFAVAQAGGARLADALRRACVAGALATTAEGAIPSLPRRDALDR